MYFANWYCYTLRFISNYSWKHNPVVTNCWVRFLSPVWAYHVWEGSCSHVTRAPCCKNWGKTKERSTEDLIEVKAHFSSNMGSTSELFEFCWGLFYGLCHFMMSCHTHDAVLSGGSSWQGKEKMQWLKGILSPFSLGCMFWYASLKNVTYHPSHNLKWNRNDPACLCTWTQSLTAVISALGLL